jgi:hypothetical protein
MNSNYAVFVDLENAGGKPATLQNIIDKVKMRGDILLSKVYGYCEEFSSLKELLLSNTFAVVPSLKFGINQKNNMDIQLVIDALEVAYTNPHINCYCIVSGDSDYTPLVGKLKAMGKFVLGISRSECAARVFINACSEFLFLETVSNASKADRQPGDTEDDTIEDEAKKICKIISEQCDADGYMHASALKNTLIRLQPDFSEKKYGFQSFGRMLAYIQKEFETIECEERGKVLRVRCAKPVTRNRRITRENFIEVMTPILQGFKDDGFERVNPSIIKQNIMENYQPDFKERDLGVKRFSDVMRLLENNGKVELEFDENHSMVAKIL